jgi:HEAT repeat protein
MPLLIFIILIVALVIWWAKSNSAMSYNERQYLKRRGYAVDEGLGVGPPARQDARMRTALDSLSDLSPFSRQRAAQDLARICEEGQRDSLMFYPLIEALQDSDASVRTAAAEALGRLGDARAIDALKQRLAIEDSIQTLSSLRKALQRLEES